MRVVLSFDQRSVELDAPDDRTLGVRTGPTARPAGDLPAMVRRALMEPLGFPPLPRTVVPGDKVVIPFGADIPEAGVILGEVISTLLEAGVNLSDITILSPGAAPPGTFAGSDPTPRWEVHDPADTSRLAYLASTQAGRRIYLNRNLTDADVVFPIGRLGFDPFRGRVGPWSLLFPDMSNVESQARGPKDHDGDDSDEVGWLLGSGPLQMGVLGPARGVSRILTGSLETIREAGTASIDEAWTFRVPERAGLVVVSVSKPGGRGPSGFDEMAAAFETARRIVRRGGAIVLLSETEGSPGPALRRLADPARSESPSALKGLEREPDYLLARELVRTRAWADLYAFSHLDKQWSEDMEITALDRPEQARRLIEQADSVLFVDQANLTRVEVADDES